MRSIDKKIFIIKLPMRIQSSKKKKTALNLNIYRNLHHRSLHAQKKNFHKIVSKLLKNIPKLGKIHLHYDICPQTKRRLDVMNVGSVVDKYFSDTLTELKIIEDDDYKNINFVSFGFGGLSKIECVIVKITEIEPRKKLMKILLDQNDIQTALDNYLETLNIEGATGVDLYKAENGNIEAEIMIGEIKKEQPKPKRKGRGPAKPKTNTEEVVDVAEADDDSSTNSGGGSLENDEKKANEKKSDSAGGSKSKNPFEDEDGPSSESEDTSGQEGKTTSVNKPKEVKKKASIFDS